MRVFGVQMCADLFNTHTHTHIYIYLSATPVKRLTFWCVSLYLTVKWIGNWGAEEKEDRSAISFRQSSV